MFGNGACQCAKARPRFQHLPGRVKRKPAQQRPAEGTQVIHKLPVFFCRNHIVILIRAIVLNNGSNLLIQFHFFRHNASSAVQLLLIKFCGMGIEIFCHNTFSIFFAIFWFSISFRCEGIAPYSYFSSVKYKSSLDGEITGASGSISFRKL